MLIVDGASRSHKTANICHINFLSGMHGFQDKEFLFRVSLTVSELFDILFWLVIAHSEPF